MLLDAKLAEILDQIQKAVVKYAPEAMRLVLHAIQLQAILQLVAGGVAVLLALVSIGLMVMFIGRGYRDNWRDGANIFMSIVSGIGGVVMTVVASCQLFDRMVWMAAVDPRLALAWAILKKTGLFS